MPDKTYEVTIGLDYGEVTVTFDIPEEFTTTDDLIYKYISGNVEYDWEEVN